MKSIRLVLTNNEGRLDKFLTDRLKDSYNFSRSYIQKLIDEGYIKVNDNEVTPKYNLLENDEIYVELKVPTELDAKPQKIDFKIVYEDDDLIVVDKPNNLVVHPAAGNPDGTLVNGLLYKLEKLSSIGGVLRPGIVHRLDKMTTGLMIVAKNDKTHRALTEMLAKNKIHKEYLALVHGVVEPNTGLIDAPIGRQKHDRKKMTVTDLNSKNARTHFTVMKRFKKHTLLKCVIETGRTHQIRVHMNYIKHPVLGDPLYAYKEDEKMEFGQYLHSHNLSFEHPISKKNISLNSDLPKEFNDKLKELEE